MVHRAGVRKVMRTTLVRLEVAVLIHAAGESARRSGGLRTEAERSGRWIGLEDEAEHEPTLDGSRWMAGARGTLYQADCKSFIQSVL